MAAVSCAKCNRSLPLDGLELPGRVTCSGCRNPQSVTLFPALGAEPEAPATSAPIFEGDTACYYDPDKRAVAVCDDCGRFISEFHRVVLSSDHTTCLACLSNARSTSNKALTVRERTCYDNLALALAIVPPLTLVGLYFVIFTAPATLYVVIRYWKRGPNSVIPRGRTRFVIAAIIAILELVILELVILAFVGIAGFLAYEANPSDFNF